MLDNRPRCAEKRNGGTGGVGGRVNKAGYSQLLRVYIFQKSMFWSKVSGCTGLGSMSFLEFKFCCVTGDFFVFRMYFLASDIGPWS